MSASLSNSEPTLETAPRNRFENVPYRQAKATTGDVNKVDDHGKRQKEEALGRARFGAVLRRAVELAGLVEKEAAARMRVDRAQFSRWLSGVENAQVWKFHADDLLGPALIAAQAEVTPGAIIETVIKLERKVG